ncbi:MAG: pilus assembly protein TadG-related protein, partial [Candidatus Binatia bacterium]
MRNLQLPEFDARPTGPVTMVESTPSTKTARGQRGGASVLVAGGLAVTIGMAALVIDVGQLMATKAELQMVADLAA